MELPLVEAQEELRPLVGNQVGTVVPKEYLSLLLHFTREMELERRRERN